MSAQTPPLDGGPTLPIHKRLLVIYTHLALWLHRYRVKLSALLFWSLTIGVYWWFSDRYDLSPAGKILFLTDWFADSIYGPPLFIVVFVLQPLVFFPSFLLGIAGGILYGPLLGTIYVTLAANGAANVCYWVGRFFGKEFLARTGQGTLLQRYAERLRTNTFETILIMHLLVVVPFDIVNYVAGFLRLDWKSFAFATAMGALPGILTFVFFGHSLGGIDKLMAGKPEIDMRMLAMSGIMLLVGLGFAHYVKRSEE